MLASEVKFINEDSLDDYDPSDFRAKILAKYSKADFAYAKDAFMYILNTIIPKVSNLLITKMPELKAIRKIEYSGDGFIYPTGSCNATITFEGCPTNDAGKRLDKRVIRENPYEKIILSCMYDPEITGKFAVDPRYQSVWIDTDLYGRLTLTLHYNIPEKKELDS